MRFAQTDKRIDRIGAMSGAMTSAAINTAGLPGQIEHPDQIFQTDGLMILDRRKLVLYPHQQFADPHLRLKLK